MIEELIGTFESSVKFMEQSVADLSEQQMLQQPPGVPNHGTWTLGHVIYSCQGVAGELGAKEWLPGDWESVFGYGSTPTSEAFGYPSKAEILEMLTDAAGRLRQALLATDESTLGQPLPNKQVHDMLPTVGHALVQVIAAHTAFHAGQLAVWRRAIGKRSATVFI